MAKQLTRLPYVLVYVKFQFYNTSARKFDSRFMLVSTISNVLLGWGSKQAFSERLEVRNVFHSAA